MSVCLERGKLSYIYMMSSNIFFRLFYTAILISWLPSGSFASNKLHIYSIATKITWQDRKDKRQERGKENKKPEVKEVPQSRKQEKPEEVKPDRKEKPKESKRKNN